jgi:hypothetical protein
MASRTGEFDWLEREIAAAVTPLCERYGYGAVMGTASRLWRERDSVGALAMDDGAARRVAGALLQYAIGDTAADDGLYVDWRYVAEQMAAALDGGKDGDDEAGTPPL